MKVLGIISTATLFLLLGTAVTAVAQDEHHDEGAKPAQHEEQAKPAKQEQAKPEQREAQPKAAKQETQNQPAQHEQQAKPAKQQQQAKPEQRQEQARSTKQGEQQQAKNQQQQTRSNDRQAEATQQENRRQANNRQPQRSAADEQRQRSQPALRLSARGEGRIPDDRFRSNFGRDHRFRIGSPRMVDGYSRFQYGGYWFGFVQPWPADWYYTDDVYVDYINGQYYLCNPSYPGDQIAISVVL